MYIALKWLISLASIMWLAMCFTDLLLKDTRRNIKGVPTPPTQFNLQNNSNTKQIMKLKGNKQYVGYKRGQRVTNIKKEQGIATLHLMMFAAGALVVSMFNKKTEIALYARKTLNNVDWKSHINPYLESIKNAAYCISAAISNTSVNYWEKIKQYITATRNTYRKNNAGRKNLIYAALLEKIKQMGEERKNLGQLLISAINENKNIRMRYQLETMAKNRLAQHIESTNKQIKENRSRYVSFQQLYLTTHQENSFLKAKLRKIIKEKEEVEDNMSDLLNEIFKSTDNNKLKTYCTKFLMKTRNNLIDWDPRAEIERFLDRSSHQSGSGVHLQKSDVLLTDRIKNLRYNNSRLTEILQNDCLLPTISDAPKLKGLPGECVWTVKDKDGIIEKLYEYDYESEFDNGDTMRRIRQYSVYYDKDCFLDISNPSPSSGSCSRNLELPLGTNKLVTGSEVFQNFLRYNNSVVPLKEPSLLAI